MLVRYCARHTGDPDVAEDLAQQALLEAWRKLDTLYGPAVREYWLLGVARNVCLRWARRHGAEASRLTRPGETSGSPDIDSTEDFDVELELERDELARLLDRALALLPPATRAVLVQRYIEESPQAEVAARLGLTEGAVEARVHRGKLALKKVLTTELREEAFAHGVIQAGDACWQETRIWCPDCGRRRLVGRFAEGRDLQLDCPDCLDGSRAVQVRSWVAERAEGISLAELFADIKGYKPALNRLMARSHDFYRHGIAGLTTRCLRCGGPAPLRTHSYRGFGHEVQTDCPRCDQASGISTVNALALDTPEGRAFWRGHGRIRTLPDREVKTAGASAIVSSFESVTGSARLEVVLARDNLEVIGVHETPGW
jgi:RNA polymerase sigma factor (sigma-70 family)